MDERWKKRIIGIVIGVFLGVYALLTVFPFYLLFILSFVPTNQSTKLHLWIPELLEFEMNGRYGDMGTYYSMDLQKFKKVMGIRGYINPNTTFNKIAEKHDIPGERILAYMNPLVPLINGFQGTFSTNYQAIYAGLAISVIPILIVYLVFQNLFVRSA